MKITIIAVGKIKADYYTLAIREYSKRLSRYTQLKVLEVADERCPEKLSQAEMLDVKNIEGKRILGQIKKDDYVVTLEVAGKAWRSKEFALHISNLEIKGISEMIFIVGGSLGLSDEVKERAQLALSFSQMTFPHALMRVVLLEQIYRAFRINRNEPYHKGCLGDVDI